MQEEQETSWAVMHQTDVENQTFTKNLSIFEDEREAIAYLAELDDTNYVLTRIKIDFEPYKEEKD